MKYMYLKVWLALTCVFGGGGSLCAQIRQGTIIYEQKIDVHRHLQDEQMKAMVPQFQTAGYELLFRDSISVYKIVPKDDAPDPFESGGGAHIVMKFGGPGDDGVLYKNFGSGRLMEEASLADKKYRITDSIPALAWKLSEERVTILGHVCKKAMTVTSRGSKVVAWYAEEIAIPAGPDKFSGLPGIVLKLDVDSGGVVFTATKILPSVEASELKAPSGGLVITRAGFEKKMDEVMGPADAQGRRIIRN
jgi:GLPGLI family protein